MQQLPRGTRRVLINGQVHISTTLASEMLDETIAHVSRVGLGGKLGQGVRIGNAVFYPESSVLDYASRQQPNIRRVGPLLNRQFNILDFLECAGPQTTCMIAARVMDGSATESARKYLGGMRREGLVEICGYTLRPDGTPPSFWLSGQRASGDKDHGHGTVPFWRPTEYGHAQLSEAFDYLDRQSMQAVDSLGYDVASSAEELPRIVIAVEKGSFVP